MHYADKGTEMCVLLATVDEISYYTKGICSEGSLLQKEGQFLPAAKKAHTEHEGPGRAGRPPPDTELRGL